MEQLNDIYGIGIPQSVALYAKLIKKQLISKSKKYTTAELKRILKNNTDIYDSLSTGTRAYLKYNPIRKFKCSTVKTIETSFKKSAGKKVQFEFLGSYSRSAPICNDIDILISDKSSFNEFKALVETSNIKFAEPYLSGPTKTSTMLKFRGKWIKVDLFFSSKSEWLFQRVFLTGSKNFNLRSRAVAKRHGYLLSQHGLFNRESMNRIAGITTEKLLFKKIGMTYKTPKERDL